MRGDSTVSSSVLAIEACCELVVALSLALEGVVEGLDVGWDVARLGGYSQEGDEGWGEEHRCKSRGI